MSSFRGRRSAIVLLAAGVLLALPTAASAGCGDYLDNTTKDHKSRPGSKSNAPCHGPNCSQAPPPLAPAGHVTPVIPPVWDALLELAIESPTPSAGGWPESSPLLRKRFLPSSLFRPPRRMQLS